MRHRQLLVLAPIAGSAAGLAVLVGAMLAISSIVGGASAQQGCTSDPVTTLRGAPAQLTPLFGAAAIKYGLGNQGAAILAGLTSIESGFGKNMGPSSAGAIGWTQFMPATWARWGVDANHDGRRDPYTAADAIFSSARYLRASGAPADWHGALFAYNHSDAYVAAVLAEARRLGGSQPVASSAGGSSTLVVGDSLEVGTFPLLVPLLGGHLDGDSEGGRSSTTGIAVLRRLLDQRDYTTIVFDLGTNDASAAEFGRSLTALAALAGDRRLVLATVNSPYAEREKNAMVRRFALGHANVTVVPWKRVSQKLTLADGIHGAYPERARLMARALGQSDPIGSCNQFPVAIGPIRRVTGGGQLVAIPGQPGMTIDSRILADIEYLIRVYHVTVTAGYAPTGHAANGEHPLGLAVDLVPGPQGTWDDVDRLARWAEPVQNAPRPPFRWVGYDGDANHGRGNHLHLSWTHAPAPSRRPPAAWVETFSSDPLAA